MTHCRIVSLSPCRFVPLCLPFAHLQSQLVFVFVSVSCLRHMCAHLLAMCCECVSSCRVAISMFVSPFVCLSFCLSVCLLATSECLHWWRHTGKKGSFTIIFMHGADVNASVATKCLRVALKGDDGGGRRQGAGVVGGQSIFPCSLGSMEQIQCRHSPTRYANVRAAAH